MDVNVRDIDEIVRFGRSLHSFVSDYVGVLRQIGSRSFSDYTTARNCYNTIRTYAESAERELKNAERVLENAYETADRYPEEDHSDKIAFLEQGVEKKRMIYERNRQALEEAEGLLRNVKVTTERVYEEVQRTTQKIQEDGHSALSAIQSAAKAIAGYLK